ncbi:unnamed protein product, partial [Taenia asiatica]|uniref:Recep_L_domain domain-containing protein n=1 Tax=Taenia asiatica TaxID=60517 RepID=A0A0R3VZT2_TAEAS
MESNELAVLSPGKLKGLQMLRLDDNVTLHDLQSELVWCSSLRTISTVNCPLSRIPVNVVSAGPSLLIQSGVSLYSTFSYGTITDRCGKPLPVLTPSANPLLYPIDKSRVDIVTYPLFPLIVLRLQFVRFIFCLHRVYLSFAAE